MFSSNPFAALSASVSPDLMQTFVWIMVLCVVGGTLFDVIHKGSAKYFFAKMDKSNTAGNREVSGGEKMGMAVQTALSEVATSSEFCNPQRRIAHLIGMYGFIGYALATFVMVMYHPTNAAPGIWAPMWWVGALAVCVGVGWFWFFIRVDVRSEGNGLFPLVQADLFPLSLMASCSLAVLWGATGNTVLLGLYLIATVVLFGGVPWSKFSHMFFKPAAALDKRISKASGFNDNLPFPADRSDPADSDRHSMELLKDAPMDMGLGIKRESPDHY